MGKPVIRHIRSGGSADIDDGGEAEANLAKLKESYTDWIVDDLAAMKEALRRATEEDAGRLAHLKELFDVSHNVKAQGTTFGYELMTLIGQSLCDFLRKGDRTSAADLKVVDAHVKAMQVIIENRIAGDGGDAGKALVQGLDRLTK